MGRYDDEVVREWTVFVLRMANGYYYIGYTSCPRLSIPRYERGDEEKCSKWVCLHGGGEVSWRQKFSGTQYDAIRYVTRQVLRLCDIVGISKVRGGFLVTMDDDKHKREATAIRGGTQCMPGPKWRALM